MVGEIGYCVGDASDQDIHVAVGVDVLTGPRSRKNKGL